MLRALWLMACLVVGLLLGPALTSAREAQPLADNVALEQRMMAIADELRCLVCQNETLAVSQADLAVDLREQIRDQLKSGRTPQQIRDYMVARYGEFVLYRPRFSVRTVALWLGPFALLLLAFGVWWRVIRRRGADPEPAALAPEEQARARQLLDVPPEQNRS